MIVGCLTLSSATLYTYRYMDWIKWAGLTIIADLPVTVVPIGVLPETGLPVGLQVVAPCWHDRQAIEVGRMIERIHLGAGARVPPGYGGPSL